MIAPPPRAQNSNNQHESHDHARTHGVPLDHTPCFHGVENPKAWMSTNVNRPGRRWSAKKVNECLLPLIERCPRGGSLFYEFANQSVLISPPKNFCPKQTERTGRWYRVPSWTGPEGTRAMETREQIEKKTPTTQVTLGASVKPLSVCIHGFYQ